MANPPKTLAEKELAEIETLAGLGLRFEDIALVKGMCLDTLKKYADEYLQRGRAKAKAQVMQTAYKMATSGKTPAMTMFWLKTRAGWREGQGDALPSAQENVLMEMVKGADNPAESLTMLLSHLIPQVITGNLDPSLVSSVSTLGNTLMKASQQGEMEERLKLLENTLHNNKPEPLELDL